MPFKICFDIIDLLTLRWLKHVSVSPCYYPSVYVRGAIATVMPLACLVLFLVRAFYPNPIRARVKTHHPPPP